MSETQARSILQSVAAGRISPAEAAVLLDALPADQRADEDAEPVETETQQLETERVQTQQLRTEDNTTERIDTERLEPERRTDAAGRLRTQVSAEVHGDLVPIVCEPEIEVPYADGPAASEVAGDAESGFVLEARLGDDSAIMLPSSIDLKLAVNGADFSLTGIDGTVSAELNVGNVLIDGLFVDGSSRIQANAGDVELRLRPGSDVEVISKTPATIHADGLEHSGRGRWSLGAGTAKFEIAGNLGSITIIAL